MSALRFLFAPELTRSLTDAVRSSDELVRRMMERHGWANSDARGNVANGEATEKKATNARTEKWPGLPRKKRLLSFVGLLVLLAARYLSA